MLLDLILNKIGKTHNSIAKKQHGKTPQFTVTEVINRILQNPGSSRNELFPELNPATATKMLSSIFPNKTSKSQSWFTYVLSLVQHKYCTQCNTIKAYTEYNKGQSSEGLQHICKSCDSEYQKSRYQSHKAEFKAKHIEYTLHRKLATPAWADLDKMNEIYNNCKPGNHIDHIVPLNSPIVCGLHNEFNLQEITAFENRSKGNRFDQDSYIH